MEQVTAEINFIEIALGSFVGNPNETDRQNALLSELDSFDETVKKQLKGYVRLSDKALKVVLLELLKEKNLLLEEKVKQLGSSAGIRCFMIFWLLVDLIAGLLVPNDKLDSIEKKVNFLIDINDSQGKSKKGKSGGSQVSSKDYDNGNYLFDAFSFDARSEGFTQEEFETLRQELHKIIANIKRRVDEKN